MKKMLLLLSSSLFITATAQLFAQTADVISDPNKLLEALQKDKFDIDANAKAVILYREQSSILDNQGYIEDTYEFSAKILSDEAAQDLSLINIPKGDYSTVFSISGETYNLENDKVVKQSMEKKDLKNEKIIEDFHVVKFNMPSVKKGSIIHYTYKVKTMVAVYVPDYYLQMEYPILLQYRYLRVPGFINFQKIERIDVPLTNIANKKSMDTCQAGIFTESYGSNGTLYTWVRRNEPAFDRQPFMASEENYKERIRMLPKSLEYNGRITNFYTTWAEFITNNYFDSKNYYIGSVFSRNGFFDDKINELTANAKNDLEKAEAIYKFIRNNFSIKSRDKDFNLKTTYTNKWGPAKDINLVLIAMLRRANLDCSPLLISTTKKEHLNPIYPEISNVDQILAFLKIGDKKIFLNAAKKNLPFGVLLPDSYNGTAQVVTEKPSSIELDPNDCLEKTTSLYSFTPSETKGNLTFKIDIRLSNYEAFQFREAMQNDTSQIRKDILAQLKKSAFNMELKKLDIKNLNNPDELLKIHYEGELSLNTEESTIYFNPFLDPFFSSNPFPSVARKYNIEMGHITDKNYVVNLKMPEGYVIDDFAKSKTYKYDENGTLVFSNIWSFDESSGNLSINSRFLTKETYFPADQYEGLRNFYDKIVEEQQQKIVIKKTTLN